MSPLHIDLDMLTSGERRDLPNALPCARSSAVLEETRLLVLDSLAASDDSALSEAA